VKHQKVYDDFFEIDAHNPRVCELTGVPASDIHHIDARGMGGRSSMDTIQNLMCLTRSLHEYFGDKKDWKKDLREAHEWFTINRAPFVVSNPKARLSQEVWKLHSKTQNELISCHGEGHSDM
jgi:hypothetical protein